MATMYELSSLLRHRQKPVTLSNEPCKLHVMPTKKLKPTDYANVREYVSRVRANA